MIACYHVFEAASGVELICREQLFLDGFQLSYTPGTAIWSAYMENDGPPSVESRGQWTLPRNALGRALLYQQFRGIHSVFCLYILIRSCLPRMLPLASYHNIFL